METVPLGDKPPSTPPPPDTPGEPAARPQRLSGLRQAFVSSRNLAFFITLLFILGAWSSLEQPLLLMAPWTLEALVAALLFVLLFPLAWLIGGIGGAIGWLIGRRRGQAQEGASGGALGCWLGLWLASVLLRRTPLLAPVGVLLLFLGPWIGARWLGPLLRDMHRALDRVPARFNQWAARRLVWQRPRLDLRGRFLGAVAGLFVGLLMLLPPLKYPEAFLLAMRMSLRSEPFHNALGTLEWQQLPEIRELPARQRLAHLAIVELDDEVLSRILAGSSEAAVNAAALARLRRWGARRVVVPIATTLPQPVSPPGDPASPPRDLHAALRQHFYLRRPSLSKAGIDRLQADIPALLAQLRATPDAILCPLAVGSWNPESPWTGAVLAPLLRGAPVAGSARFGLYHFRQLLTLHARDAGGKPAVPLLLRVPGARGAAGSSAGRGASWTAGAPTVRPGELLLSYSGSGPQVVVPHVPYSALLEGRPVYDPAQGRWVPAARFFRNRIVFLDTLYQPSYNTPVGRLTAMELLTAALDTLTASRPLEPPAPWLQVVIAMLFGALTGRLALGRSPLQGFWGWTAALAIYLLLAFGLFIYPGLWLPIAPVMVAGLVAFLLVNQFVFAADEAERRRQRVQQMQRERELAVSREIQMGLMPEPLIRVGSCLVASRSEPAREVGGNFSNVFALGEAEGPVGIVLGDVSGKGVQGALLMTVATTLLEARATPGLPPREVLADANRRLYPKLRRRRMFVTAVYGVLDPESGIWTYASAGQVPPLHLTASGQVCYLPAAGPPLGSLKEPRYQDERITLGPGEGLLLASDGFVEARSRTGQTLGYDGFRQLVERHLPQAPEGLLAGLFDGIAGFLEGPAQDDLTLLLVWRTG